MREEMMRDKNSFKQPMMSWPSLEKYARIVHVLELHLNLFVFDSGRSSKPTIMLIHGLGDEADTWRHVFEPLADLFRVIAVDLPGFGRSDKPDRDYTPKFMMDAILKLADHMDLSEIILMGSSMGAILAHSIALRNPERVQKLILVGGALLQNEPVRDKGLALMKIPLLGEWLYTRLQNDPNAAYDSLRTVYFNLDQMPEPDREFLFYRVNQRVYDDGQKRAYLSALRHLYPWAKMSQSNLIDQLNQLTVPTLIIRGEHDPLMGLNAAEGLSNLQPNSELVNIQGAGHLPHQEKPTQFIEAVKIWLS